MCVYILEKYRGTYKLNEWVTITLKLIARKLGRTNEP